MIAIATLAALGSAAAAAAAAPADVRVIAGSMPGFPIALPQVSPKHALTPAKRRLYSTRFLSIRIGAPAAAASSRLGRIHKIQRYTQAGNACDYFDGGFVLCIYAGHVAAKGYEIG